MSPLVAEAPNKEYATVKRTQDTNVLIRVCACEVFIAPVDIFAALRSKWLRVAMAVPMEGALTPGACTVGRQHTIDYRSLDSILFWYSHIKPSSRHAIRRCCLRL